MPEHLKLNSMKGEVCGILNPHTRTFGGKSQIAHEIWKRFGNVPNYVDPFFGSMAVPLARPHAPRIETVNDLCGWMCNFWRAVQHDPDAVAHHADWPVSELDLHARGDYLFWRPDALEWVEKLRGDPDFYDAKSAGWWVWGQSCWIGQGWQREPSREGKGEKVTRQVPHLSGRQGVTRQMPRIVKAGVHRKMPSTTNRGEHAPVTEQGVKSKSLHDGAILRIKPSTGNRGVLRNHVEPVGDDTSQEDFQIPTAGGLRKYMRDLSERTKRMRVMCGDWSRAVSPSITFGQGLTAVILDPPYGEGSMEYAAGGNKDGDVAQAVKAWALENGGNKELRIALCGYEGYFDPPEGWETLRWKAQGGYGNQADREGRANARRERIWFSPACLKPKVTLFTPYSK